MNWEDIDGWFDWRPWMLERIAELPAGAQYVEVGAFLGRSTAATAGAIRDSGKKIQLVAVDLWDATCFKDEPVLVRLVGSTGSFMARFESNMQRCGVGDWISPLRMGSLEASKLPSMRPDVVFLDGDHSYEGLRADIAAWWPVLKPGGYMAGHDMITYPNVWNAVHDELSHTAGLRPKVIENQNMWEVRKPI